MPYVGHGLTNSRSSLLEIAEGVVGPFADVGPLGSVLEVPGGIIVESLENVHDDCVATGFDLSCGGVGIALLEMGGDVVADVVDLIVDFLDDRCEAFSGVFGEFHW